MKDIKKHLYRLAGGASLACGITGIFVPVLPTTPFLLLSSYCFARSSERMNRWLNSHRVLGEYLYNYRTYHAVKRKTKALSLVFLWASLIISMVAVGQPPVCVLLALIGVLVSLHILSLKSI